MTTPATWRKNADGCLTLHFGGGRALLRVVPDKTYAGMWRIQTPAGRLSDMVNLARAKDAALSIAVRIVNPQKQGGETPAEGPSVAQMAEGAS